jgi:hypothetical protein
MSSAIRQELAVLGAHGGTGATTLARLLNADDFGSCDDGILPPLITERDLGDTALLLTCRPTTLSATWATEAVRELTRARVPVAVLVICGDGWPETRVATARYRLLSAQVGAVARMPFTPAIRGYSHPEDVRLPRSARNALNVFRLLAARRVAAWTTPLEAS